MIAGRASAVVPVVAESCIRTMQRSRPSLPRVTLRQISSAESFLPAASSAETFQSTQRQPRASAWAFRSCMMASPPYLRLTVLVLPPGKRRQETAAASAYGAMRWRSSSTSAQTASALREMSLYRREGQVALVVFVGHHKEGGGHFFGGQSFENGGGDPAGAVVEGEADHGRQRAFGGWGGSSGAARFAPGCTG